MNEIEKILGKIKSIQAVEFVLDKFCTVRTVTINKIDLETTMLHVPLEHQNMGLEFRVESPHTVACYYTQAHVGRRPRIYIVELKK